MKLTDVEKSALKSLHEAGGPVAAFWSSRNYAILRGLAKSGLITFDSIEANITPAGRAALEQEGK